MFSRRRVPGRLLLRIRSHGNVREASGPAIDFKTLLANKEEHVRNAQHRHCSVDLECIDRLYGEFRSLTVQVQRLNQARKHLAREFARSHVEAEQTLAVLDDAQAVREHGEALMARLRRVTGELHKEAARLPNTTHSSTPLGGPEQNQQIRTWGPSPRLIHGPLDHVEIARRLDIVDFEAGARTSGSAFCFLKNQGALLEMALVQYALKKALEAGFRPILPPDIVWGRLIGACGFWPRSDEKKDSLPAYQVFLDGGDQEGGGDVPPKVLAATSEIPMAAYYAGKALGAEQLPRKWVAVSHCFRPETGHYGAESRGLYRMHQFTKVELFILKDADVGGSNDALQEILALQQAILAPLDIPCRLLNMASAELGASAHQKYDIEAFFPGRNDWGELTSASNCTDYQSRRLGLRYQCPDGSLQYAHTLNGTACAIPRTIQAIIENHYQPSDGSIPIPAVLHPFMIDGSTRINKN